VKKGLEHFQGFLNTCEHLIVPSLSYHFSSG
jgi:hypothetical protein